MLHSKWFLPKDVIFYGKGHPNAPDALIGRCGGMDMFSVILKDLAFRYGWNVIDVRNAAVSFKWGRQAISVDSNLPEKPSVPLLLGGLAMESGPRVSFQGVCATG